MTIFEQAGYGVWWQGSVESPDFVELLRGIEGAVLSEDPLSLVDARADACAATLQVVTFRKTVSP